MPRRSSNATRRRGKPSPRRAKPGRTPAGIKARLYHVDAFTRRLFHGNPAAVLVAQALPDDPTMRTLAAELNQPVTAFLAPGAKGAWIVRWFTPAVELPLCGHGAIAAAHALFTHEKHRGTRLILSTAEGPVPVDRNGDLLVIDLPARPGEPCDTPRGLVAALGRTPAQVLRGRHLVAVFDNKRDVHEMQPDFAVIAAMDVGVTVTAPAAGHDYVCRVFIPNHGINEDHASGSPQATLVPYWAARLGKKSLTAHQVSPRGGELFCDLVGKRVRVGGRAVTFATTSVRLPA